MGSGAFRTSRARAALTCKTKRGCKRNVLEDDVLGGKTMTKKKNVNAIFELLSNSWKGD